MNAMMDFLSYYGIWAMLLIIFLEYACFPVSSEIVLPVSGAIAATNQYPFLLMVPCSVIAGLLGTYLCYLFGKWGGRPFLERIMLRFPKSEPGIMRSCEYFERRGCVTVCLLRMVPLCRTYVAFAAGALGMDHTQYLGASRIGITIWNSILIGAGYKLGEHWSEVSNWYATYKHILIPVLIILFVTIFAYRYLKKHWKTV